MEIPVRNAHDLVDGDSTSKCHVNHIFNTRKATMGDFQSWQTGTTSGEANWTDMLACRRKDGFRVRLAGSMGVRVCMGLR